MCRKAPRGQRLTEAVTLRVHTRSMAQEPPDGSWPTEAHVKFATEALERFSDWIRFADAKAGVVLVVLGLALSDLLKRAGAFVDAGLAASAWGEVATVAFWVAGGLAVATTVLVIMTLFPRRPQARSRSRTSVTSRRRAALRRTARHCMLSLRANSPTTSPPRPGICPASLRSSSRASATHTGSRSAFLWPGRSQGSLSLGAPLELVA